MSALPKPASSKMTVDAFLAFAAAASGRWQLVEGEAVAMAPANTTHGAMQNELGRLIANALLAKGAPCSVFTEPGVIPRVFANENVRVPDLAVMCGDYKTERRVLAEPVVLIEILSPSNEDSTRYNVWAYASIPSVAEIALFHAASIAVEFWRRLPDGSWPEAPELIETGELSFASIGVRFALADAYRTTRLAP